MIKAYPWNDTTRLSPHFITAEFRCKCGKAHETLIDEELVSKLERLYSRLNCSRIVITSGYRCPAHDAATGGTSTGQHTKGTAADICCYGQDGNPIDSRSVCCAAQEEGFSGVANITSDYIYTHVDVRTGSRWLGDEVVSNNTVTDDFYSYFGITKNVQKAVLYKGIDVSVYQGKINWDKVKASGIQFAILRAGYGKELSQVDTTFERNYQECKRLGIPVGVYWYSYARTVAEAKQESAVCLSAIQGKQFEFPVAYDIEEQDSLVNGSALCQAFCEELEAAGYYAAIYSFKNALETSIAPEVRQRYDVFLSHVDVDQSSYSGSYGLWQYSWKGNVDGIVGDVDLDYAYKDYPAIIKSAGLNGFGATSEQAPEPEQEQDRKSEAIQHIEEALEILKK